MIFSNTTGILGMNARNLNYIAHYNSHANKKFADDKIFTKQFLQSRGVGVAKLYQVVKNQRELTHDFFASLPESFVIKPNRGFAGAGIVVIVAKKGASWMTVSGKKLTEENLYRQCIDILEGKYSITGTSDSVIFEECLEAHDSFRLLTETGLPDVRVIVYNLVPVMAMLRVPTEESDGKANMELGALALGVDMGTGITTGGAKKSKIVRQFPNGEKTAGFTVPYWNEILHAVAKIQSVTKIGFLGVDLVITNTGIKVLEVNARPGLKIQIANRAPLGKRLAKVTDLKVLTPEEGVEVAKTLFAQKSAVEENFVHKPIIGGFENVQLHSDPPQSLVAKIMLVAEANQISKSLYDEESKLLDITLEGVRLKLPVEPLPRKLPDCDLVLAGKYLGDFYIDSQKPFEKTDLVALKSQSIEESMIKKIDQKINEIDQQIKLLFYINPQNIVDQKELFFSTSDFAPRFRYRELEIDTDSLRAELKKLPEVSHFLFPLYAKKIAEINDKLSLLEARGSQDFSIFSQRVFGRVSRHIYQESLKFLEQYLPEIKPDESRLLDLKASAELIKDFLAKYNLSHWEIKTITETVADIQIVKSGKILLKKGVKFHRNRLEALLVHEIGTHVFRLENGRQQPLRLLERGTAGYLKTEEGLAVWNQNQLGLDLGDKFLTPALHSVAVFMAGKMGFADLFDYLKQTFALDDELAWKLCLKCKRGLIDTGRKGAFTKDSVYFQGLREVERFLEKGGAISELYVGKIGIGDLATVQKIDGLREAKFLL